MSIPDTLQRIDLSFPNSLNTKPSKISPNAPSGYLNYFKPWCSTGITQVYGNQRLLYPNLYSNIDLMFYGNYAGEKFYFICDEKSRPQDIQLKYDGATSVAISSGKLVITSKFGIMTEAIPTAFQIDGNGNVVTLNWQPSFTSLGGNKFSFSFGSYNSSEPLIIEIKLNQHPHSPQLLNPLPEWCTYYGGGNQNYLGGAFNSFTDVKTDAAGHVYVYGNSWSNMFPLVPGANVIQSQFSGWQDCVLLRFESTGVENWATYYGGSFIDEPSKMAIDDVNGLIYFTGTTQSDDFPCKKSTTANALNDSTLSSPAYNPFLVKLSTNGFKRYWATYYGGTGFSHSYGIDLGPLGDIYIAGRSDSTIPKKFLTGAYNQTHGDGFIAEFTPDEVLHWATCLDSIPTAAVAWDIDVDDNKTLYVCGQIGFNGLSIKNAGANTSFQGGSSDGFVMAFDAQNALTWSTYYGGPGDDKLYAIHGTGLAKVLVGGSSGSSAFTLHLPTYNSFYHDTTGLGVLLQFDGASGVQNWGTLYNGVTQISSIAVDDIQNFYVTGFTGFSSMSLIPSNPPYIFSQTTKKGTSDAFILCFDKTGARRWTTYFGGDNSENFPTIGATYLHSKYYLVGTTFSNSGFPLNNPMGGAYYQDTFPANTYNMGFIAQFDINPLVGIDDPHEVTNSSLKVFPNPNNGEFTIELTDAENGFIATLYDCAGRQIYSLSSRQSFLTVNMPEASGIYILKVQSAHSSLTKKIIVQ